MLVAQTVQMWPFVCLLQQGFEQTMQNLVVLLSLYDKSLEKIWHAACFLIEKVLLVLAGTLKELIL